MPIKLNLNGNTRWLIGGAAAIVAAAAVTLSQVSDLQADQEKIDKRIDCLESNQRTLDEGQRNGAADMQWSLKKLDAMMEKLEVTERIERPRVEPSKLKEPIE